MFLGLGGSTEEDSSYFREHSADERRRSWTVGSKPVSPSRSLFYWKKQYPPGEIQNLPREPGQPIRCLKCRRSTLRLMAYIIVYIFMLYMGSLVFLVIERPVELAERDRVVASVTKFLAEHSCVSNGAFDAVVSDILYAGKLGLTAQSNLTIVEPNWGFGQAVFFATTIVTTIGYGRTAPMTPWGKVFCIAFALIGIPMTLVLFSAIVERIMIPTDWLYVLLRTKFSSNYSDALVRTVLLGIVTTLVVLLFVLLPAGVFIHIEEGWSYLDAVYFCFISLTTVGLGDYVPGEQHDQHWRTLYKITATVYLFIGITMVMLTLRLFNEIPQLNFGYKIYLTSDLNEEKTDSKQADTEITSKSFVDSGMGASSNQNPETAALRQSNGGLRSQPAYHTMEDRRESDYPASVGFNEPRNSMAPLLSE